MADARLGQRPDPEETARYVAEMAKELRALAAKADLGFLAYLLAMVEDDAAATARSFVERKGA